MADLNSFKSTFKGDLVTPTEAGVVLAIKYAPITKLLIAIRGGGHSPAGASSSEGGLVIDLSRYLTSVTVDAEKKLAYAGGGALWEAVDKAAIVHGLAMVRGTVNHVLEGVANYAILAPAYNVFSNGSYRVTPHVWI